MRDPVTDGDGAASSSKQSGQYSCRSDNGVQAFGRATRPRHASSTPETIPLSFAELTELNIALEMSRSEIQAVREEVSAATATNARLERKLRRLNEDLDQARHLAFHDALTGLANRNLLGERLDQAIALAKRNEKQVAVLLLDLDRFKGINDCFGHSAGDAILCEVAGRIGRLLRASDTACRYGGDEFVIVLPDILNFESALTVAQNIGFELARPYVIGVREVIVTASIGMALYPRDGVNCRELVDWADKTMYGDKARPSGKDRFDGGVQSANS